MERVAVLSGNCIEFSVINIESKSTSRLPSHQDRGGRRRCAWSNKPPWEAVNDLVARPPQALRQTACKCYGQSHDAAHVTDRHNHWVSDYKRSHGSAIRNTNITWPPAYPGYAKNVSLLRYNISVLRPERTDDQIRTYRWYVDERYIRTLIHVLS